MERMNPAAEPSRPATAPATDLRAGAEPGDPGELHQQAARAADLDLSLRRCSAGRETAAEPARQPPLVEDVVVSVLVAQRVEFTWTAAADAGVAGYHVERAAVEVCSDDQLQRLSRGRRRSAEPSVGAIRRIGPFEPLTNGADWRRLSFVDDGVDLTKPQTIEGEPSYDRALECRAPRSCRAALPLRRLCLSHSQREQDRRRPSGPSPAVFTIPSSPQHVFSREDGTTCQLKWAANPEQGIAATASIAWTAATTKSPSRASRESPLAATTFADPAAGKQSRALLHRRRRCPRPGRLSLLARLVPARMAAVLHAVHRRVAPVAPGPRIVLIVNSGTVFANTFYLARQAAILAKGRLARKLGQGMHPCYAVSRFH